MESRSGGTTPIPWLALVAMGLSVVVIANDFSAINVAIPTMEKDFQTNVNTMQWVVNAYALTFGVLIVTGGRLADMFGRRRAFFVGTAIFASMSALGGAAPTETFLIFTRVLMGVGGALMWPAILGMTYEILPEERAGLAGGIIIGAAGLGNADRAADRRGLHRPPHLALDLLRQRPGRDLRGARHLCFVHVKEPEVGEQKIDYAGVSAISFGLVSLLIALDQVDDWGWGDPRTIALLVIAVILIVAFVPIERRAGRNALIPREVMRNESFRASCLAILFVSATFFASLLYLPQFMQKHLGYSAARSRARDAAVPRHLRAGLVRRRPPLQPPRGEAARRHRGRLHHDRAVRVLAGRCRLRLRLAGRRDDRPRDRDRDLLSDRDHRRGDLGRRIADQPRRRHHLHVPDRRRVDRPRADDDCLLDAETPSSTGSRRDSASTRSSRSSAS